MGLVIGIDIGGTFTDVVALNTSDGQAYFHKLSSTNDNPAMAALQGLREIIEISGLGADALESVAHGTTVATNAVLQSRYAQTALITTKGFRDVLELGRQRRPDLWNLDKKKPDCIAQRDVRFELDERMGANGHPVKEIDDADLAAVVEKVRGSNVAAVAICLLHAYANKSHEDTVLAAVRKALPETFVCASSQVFNEYREYERFCSTVLNASLLPVMDRYLGDLEQGIQDLAAGVPLRVMQSNGGAMSTLSARHKPINTFLSGPAAGVIGAIRTAEAAGFDSFITFDMGGTSTDVCLVDTGNATLRIDQTIGGLPVKTPTIDVHTVGAGGGSIAYRDLSGLLKVGPESAGAVPGPACYGRGGDKPTVSDANQYLGRLNPSYLLGGRLKVDRPMALKVIEDVAGEMDLDPVDAASGILKIVNANMVQAIRVISVECGHDPRDFALLACGGAGPIHAADIARELGMRKVIVPGHPGLLCALGLLHSRLRNDFSRTRLIKIETSAEPEINQLIAEVRQEFVDWCAAERLNEDDFELKCIADLHYVGQDSELQVPIDGGALWQGDLGALKQSFNDLHRETFGYAAEAEPVELVTVRIAVQGPEPSGPLPKPKMGGSGEPIGNRDVWFEGAGWVNTPVFERDQMVVDSKYAGPAIIEQMDSCTVVLPGMTATVQATGSIILEDEA